MNESTEQLRDTIESFPLFEHLSDEWIADLADHSELRRYNADDTVIREGDSEQDRLYLILEGEARVWTRSPKGKVHLETLGEGDYFGEVSLLSDKVATATVEAESEFLGLLSIEREGLLPVVEDDQRVRERLEGMTLERARDTIGKVME